MQTIELPPRPGAAELEILLDRIKASRHSALLVDASHIAAVTTQTVQLLLACEREWKSSNLDFAVLDPSGQVAAAFERLGLPAIQYKGMELSA